MNKRVTIGKKLRFEVFKRDSFTCQYCGRKAPDVVLEVDHIVPVAKGGTNDIMNLVTSCWDCNRGKGKRKLSDDTVVRKTKREFEQMEARQEQLEMLIKRRKELLEYDAIVVREIDGYFKALTGDNFNDSEVKKITGYLKKYSVEEVLAVIEQVVGKYNRDVVVDKMGAFLYNNKHPQKAAKKFVISTLYMYRTSLDKEGMEVEELDDLISDNVECADDLQRLIRKLYKFDNYESLYEVFYELHYEKVGFPNGNI